MVRGVERGFIWARFDESDFTNGVVANFRNRRKFSRSDKRQDCGAEKRKKGPDADLSKIESFTWRKSSWSIRRIGDLFSGESLS